MKVTDFGATVKGDETKLYTLTNKTQILFTASKSLALLAVDATPRPCNVSV